LPGGVAQAGRGSGGDGLLDGGQLLLGELDLAGGEGLGQPGPGAGADERHDVLALGGDPGDGGLRGGDALVLGDAAQGVGQRQVVAQVLALEAGAVGAEVVGGEVAAGVPVAAEQAARQHAVGGDADAQAAGDRQDLGLDVARQQGVLDLQVADRVDGRGAAQRRGADLGQADVADVSGLDEFGDGADGVLDGHAGVEAGGTVDVDVVGAEPPQAVGEEVLDGGGAGVVAEPGAVGAAQRAELDADHDAVAVGAAQGVAQQQLVVAHAVEVAGVEEGDA